jgi:hypothetical protein
MEWKHIGFYAGDNRVVHAKGTNWGVVESTFVRTEWARCCRLRRPWWLQAFPTPEEDVLTLFPPIGIMGPHLPDDIEEMLKSV